MKFYNAEDSGEGFVAALKTVLRILARWRLRGPLSAQSLLNFFIDQVLAVLGEVKHKLVFKAIDKFNLLNSQMRAETDGAPVAATGPIGYPYGNKPENQTEDVYIKEYADCPAEFDQMVISIAQYFELVNLNSYKLEDLWLNLLDVLNLDRPNKFTVFKAVHH